MITEQDVFHLLDKLKVTASGLDLIPSWFLRIGAPIFCKPLAHLFNSSLIHATVPVQWKSADIHPIPKIPVPLTPSDMRPISILPVVSRVLERLVFSKYLLPSFSALPASMSLTNQFAYRPTSSTTAALCAILSHISDLLIEHPHVTVITFDYSKAFDTLRHSSVAAKLSPLNLPYCIYNWILSFLSNRTHCTSFQGKLSPPANISASIVQGSVLGPTLFNLNSCDLSPISVHNRYFKYADDAYLIVPASNVSSIPDELAHHSAWAEKCNLKLNPNKTAEIVFTRKGHKLPPPNPGIIRSDSIKILGVTVDNRLSFTEHVNTVVTKCNQSLYALRLMRQHGMQQNALQAVFKATSVSKLLYAAPSWWGYITKATLECLEGFIRRARKFGYYSPSDHDVKTLCKSADDCLFKRVLSNPAHVLRPYMPAQRPIFYALRKRTHNYMLPRKDNRNFLNRMLFSDLY